MPKFCDQFLVIFTITSLVFTHSMDTSNRIPPFSRTFFRFSKKAAPEGAAKRIIAVVLPFLPWQVRQQPLQH